MENSTSFNALKGGWYLFRNSWKPMAAYTLLVWVATLCLLSPLFSWVLNRLVARSGELVVGNSEMLNWLLSTKGMLALVLCGGLTLLGLLLQVTGLIRIAFDDGPKVNWAVKQALQWLLTDLYPLFRFCLSAFLLCVLMLLPLVVFLGAAYFLLLGSHDINYYLSVKPPEWKWALALGGASVLLWASAVGSLILRWYYALPLWLDGLRPFRSTLAVSWDATYRRFFFLLRTTGAYLAVTIVVLLILEACLFMTAGFAFSRFDQALHAPENSLAALEIAIRQGADYAEIDVQRSRDGVVVVIHDADLMKMARDPLRIRETDYADLARVDIGREFHRDFTGERLARLSDFLQKASGRIKLMIELKYYDIDSELAQETIRLVHEAGMAERVSLMSLEISSVRQMQQLSSDIPVGYLSAVSLGRLTRLDVDFLAVSAREAQSALLRRAGRKKLPVYVWTVNDIDTMLAMLELGVDGLITDDPALAAEVIDRVTELLPAERLMLRFRHLWDPFM